MCVAEGAAGGCPVCGGELSRVWVWRLQRYVWRCLAPHWYHGRLGGAGYDEAGEWSGRAEGN